LNKELFINVSQISTGFIEIPNQISLNIYVQGCEKKCIGCQNPELQTFEGGNKIYLDDVDVLLKNYSMAKWVCWLGGDAIYQPKALIEFNKKFKSKGLEICLYTGMRFEEICTDVLCSGLDVIIDGEWKGKTIKDNDTNQRIWVLAPGIEWYPVTWNELSDMYKVINFQRRRRMCYVD